MVKWPYGSERGMYGLNDVHFYAPAALLRALVQIGLLRWLVSTSEAC